ncbi:hypothetical protein TSYNTROOL_15320 [Tepidanaerobacter syntrophicus]|uniref:permease n=1 Tax=Tepidanaerobacter syntrophicus TaxID=224999 RepID=UPI001BD4C028|nr:permease [Tepidanaerobacter syntrophicus]GLI51446.1 hypothetical protein TSYNTROOL_15320 [Tepidanaerobacter syntrophicus]
MLSKIFDSTTLGFMAAAIILFIIVLIKDASLAVSASKDGLTLFVRYAVLIISSMLIAAYIQALIPKDLITSYLGGASGFKGIFLGSLIGGLTPGSPYAALPFFAGIMRMGASVPATVAMVCAWGLWSIGRIPLEAAVMGAKFTMIQVISSFILPILAGLVAWFLETIPWFMT